MSIASPFRYIHRVAALWPAYFLICPSFLTGGEIDWSWLAKIHPGSGLAVEPQLTGSLRLYSLTGPTVSEVKRIDGYTNHIIGKRDLDRLWCMDRPSQV
jgi:hypothetical protein